MCQLLGMNSYKPANLSFSLEGFFMRGGATGDHADGWGVAYSDGDGFSLLIEETAAARSAMAESVRRRATKSCNVIAHIRKATQGRVAVENCHPFRRRLWGRDWVFAHNGCVDLRALPVPQRYCTVGDTDSERIFCLLLEALYEAYDEPPSLAEMTSFLTERSNELGRNGNLNFLLSDGEVLFARRATELYFVERVYPFGVAALLDCDRQLDFSKFNHLDDRMIVVTTQPLTTERWQLLPEREVVGFTRGRGVCAEP